MNRVRPAGLVLAALIVLSTSGCGSTQKMSFFVTSVGIGDGGNLGGLAGADAHCQKLAAAIGSKKREWRAYSAPRPKTAGQRSTRTTGSVRDPGSMLRVRRLPPLLTISMERPTSSVAERHSMSLAISWEPAFTTF